jgi:hypothetical protein
VGKGSTFTVVLPIKRDGSAGAPAAEFEDDAQIDLSPDLAEAV